MAVQLPTKRTIHRLGIDVPSGKAHRIMQRLEALKSTHLVTNNGPYRFEPTTSQIWVDTTLTESELDDWCYRTKGIDYVGVWERREDQQVA